MNAKDFTIGKEFICDGGVYRCTDVGSRIVIAIRVDCVETNHGILTREEGEAQGWFNGPPYAVAERVFDEDDLEVCEPER
jgi:hypothetical protein